MSILATDTHPDSLSRDICECGRQSGKSMLACFAAAILCIGFDKLYALFGHGVTSAAMSRMFLYPLLGGAVPCLLLWLALPFWNRSPGAVGTQAAPVAVRRWRLFCSLHHSGIATLTVGSLLHGILEIAGTESAWLPLYPAAGWTLLAAGLASLGLAAHASRQPAPG